MTQDKSTEAMNNKNSFTLHRKLRRILIVPDDWHNQLAYDFALDKYTIRACPDNYEETVAKSLEIIRRIEGEEIL